MTPAEHRAAAENALADAHGHQQPTIPLLRALTHAVLALIDNNPDCTHCRDSVRPGHLCPECGLYDPQEDDHAPQ